MSDKFFFLVQSKKRQSLKIFAKFLLGGYGGAEKSTAELASHVEKLFETKVSLVGVDTSFRGTLSGSLSNFSESFSQTKLKLRMNIPRSPLWEYLINRRGLIKEGREHTADCLWTYGILGPGFALGFEGSVVYFIRSETDLGVFNNYHFGSKRFLYRVKMLLELIPRLLLRRDLAKVMSGATVVANSEYMATLTNKLFGVDAHVLHPTVDVSTIAASSAFRQGPRDRIILVGDGPIKGQFIFEYLASQFPAESFIIYTRNVSSMVTSRNIEYHPWTSDQATIFGRAKLVIIPSQWFEAYGRVAREAYLLNVPVLASNVGGLAEALDNKDEFLVDDYKNLEEWVSSLKEFLNEY